MRGKRETRGIGVRASLVTAMVLHREGCEGRRLPEIPEVSVTGCSSTSPPKAGGVGYNTSLPGRVDFLKSGDNFFLADVTGLFA